MNLRGAIVMFEMGHPIEEDRYDDSFQKLKREWKYELEGQLGIGCRITGKPSQGWPGLWVMPSVSLEYLFCHLRRLDRVSQLM